MSDQPLPPDLPLTVTLPVSLWSQVMTQLSEGAIKTCGPAYGEIDRQLQVQVHHYRQRPNGEDHAHA